MKYLAEIRNSDAVSRFLKRPRFLLGTLILVAGTTLIIAETGIRLYRI